ncbi:uncharacterized protein K460DRAFT_277359, partial [Cucurbitaria berberidis CBS 394.84]
QPKPTFHDFMRLPRELRLIIWKFSLPDRLDEIKLAPYRRASNDPAKPKFLPALCYTSKYTTEETIGVVIESSQFTVDLPKDRTFLRAFLAAAPGRFGLCRRLNFDCSLEYNMDLSKNRNLELAARCKGLRSIKLNFHINELTYRYSSPTRILHNPADLFAKHNLARLFDCKMLTKVIIQHGGYFTPLGDETIEGLCELLKQGFVNMSPKHVVKVESTRRGAPSRYFSIWY